MEIIIENIKLRIHRQRLYSNYDKTLIFHTIKEKLLKRNY